MVKVSFKEIKEVQARAPKGIDLKECKTALMAEEGDIDKLKLNDHQLQMSTKVGPGRSEALPWPPLLLFLRRMWQSNRCRRIAGETPSC